MGKNVYFIKINWKEVAKIASKEMGKPVTPIYCASVYSGYNRCKKLQDTVTNILEESKKDFKKDFNFLTKE